MKPMDARDSDAPKGRRKSCLRCATDQPHRLAHWHMWCPYCHSPRVYRGPCCRSCYRAAYDLASDLFDDLEKED